MIKIYQTRSKRWKFHVETESGDVLAVNWNTYSDRDAALTAITRLADLIEDASLEDSEHVLVEVHENWGDIEQTHYPIRENMDGA